MSSSLLSLSAERPRCARNKFVVCVAAMLCSSLASSAPKVTKQEIVVDGQRRSFFLYVPEGARGAEPAPLLVLLHGSGRDGASLIQTWKGLASKENIVLAGPNSRDPRGWSSPIDGPGFLREVVEAIKKDNAIDPRRVYLFGHSGGAVFALGMSCLESRYFAAASAHAGAFRSAAEAAVVQNVPRKVPLQLIVGKQDPFFPVQAVEATRDLFVKAGFEVDLQEITGHDHNYYGISSSVNGLAWQFLKDKKLSLEPGP